MGRLWSIWRYKQEKLRHGLLDENVVGNRVDCVNMQVIALCLATGLADFLHTTLDGIDLDVFAQQQDTNRCSVDIGGR